MRSGSLVATVLAVLAGILAAVACLFFPLTSNPGPESAQLLGIAGGVALCVTQAARSSSRSQDGYLADAVVGLLIAGGMILLFILVTAIGGAVRPSCSPARGYLPFFFLAMPVLVVQTGIGTWIGRLVGRMGRAMLVALVVQALFGAWLFVSWYREPGFRIASHVFVVVSGDLLRGGAMPAVVIAFRSATLLFGTALILAGAARSPRIRRAGLKTQVVTSPALYALAAAALVVGLTAHSLTIDQLMPKRAQMEAEYSLTKKRGALIVHADPLAVRPKDVDAVLAEGTLWLDRIAVRLGEKPKADIHVWLHASREAEEHWTGASHVDFTLPWRREVHIVGADVPHHTLGHELAHAVAGELSDNMLAIPSDFIVFQHAAIIEGLAVALTPELAVAEGLTIKEQAASMKRAGFAPPTATLFDGLSFFTESPARAYIAAGAFIESLVAHSMPDPTRALAELYRTGSLNKAAGSKEAAVELERAHDAMLDGLPLPADAALVAEERFKKPSILRDVCEPQDRDRARELRALVRTGDTERALAEAGPDASRATLEDLLADARDVEDDEGLAAAGARIDALTTAVDAADRTDELGDALWRAGHHRDAQASWDRARVDMLPIDAQRTLLAKRILSEAVTTTADHAPVAGAALDVLLASSIAARAAGFERLHYWLGVDDGAAPEQRREPRAGVALGRYIHARRLVQVGALSDAVTQFKHVLEDAKVPAVFLEQSSIGLATALVKLGRAAEASAILIAAADAAERPAVRLLMRDRAERAARAAAAPEKPARVTATSDPLWADRLLLGVDPSGDM